MRTPVGRGLRGLRASPRDVLAKGFTAALVDFSAQFLKSSQFGHALTKGEERERVVRDFLASFLPSTYAVMKGEAVDIQDMRTNQLDVMVYDRQRNSPIAEGESQILPIEALLAAVEVKSVLTKDALLTALAAAKKIKTETYPYNKRPVLYRDAGKPADGSARFMCCLFAYGTDIGGVRGDWCRSEYARLMSLVRDSGFTGFELDRIYVAGRGMLHPAEAYVIFERGEHADAGNALMAFTVHIYNFLERENRRREPAPYMHYAGKLEKGFVALPTDVNPAYHLVKHPVRNGRMGHAHGKRRRDSKGQQPPA